MDGSTAPETGEEADGNVVMTAAVALSGYRRGATVAWEEDVRLVRWLIAQGWTPPSGGEVE